MAPDERRAFSDGSKRLDESDLGSPVGGRSENRKGRVVDVLRRRIAAGNGGAGLASVAPAHVSEKTEIERPAEDFLIGQTDAQTFHDVFEYVRNHLKNGELVDLHNVKDYEDADYYLSEDGLSGFAVTSDGTLISVFSLRPGSLRAMKAAIIASGANHLDAFANKKQNLRAMYEKALGFKPVVDMDFNPAYDKSGIGAKHGNPDVTFMALPKKGQEFTQNRFGEDAASAKKLDIGRLRKEGAQTVVTQEEAKSLPQSVDGKRSRVRPQWWSNFIAPFSCPLTADDTAARSRAAHRTPRTLLGAPQSHPQTHLFYWTQRTSEKSLYFNLQLIPQLF